MLTMCWVLGHSKQEVVGLTTHTPPQNHDNNKATRDKRKAMPTKLKNGTRCKTQCLNALAYLI